MTTFTAWGGRALAVPDWYPDFAAVMGIGKSTLSNAPGLFPTFGMPSL